MPQPRHHISVKPGTVLVANADSTYSVLPDTGRDCGIPIDGVRPVIESDLAPGDRVVLFWERPGEHPRILVTGSGGMSCYTAYNEWGALFG